MKDFLDIFLFIKEQWFKKTTCFIVCGLFFCAYITLLWPYVNIEEINLTKIITNIIAFRNLTVLLIIVQLVFISIWYFSRKIPKVGKNEIGIAIAIKTNNRKHKVKAKNDFINSIYSNLIAYGKFKIIDLSEYYVHKIETNSKQRNKYHKKTNCRLFLYGCFDTRTKNNEECYYLKLTASLTHKPIDSRTQQGLAIEMCSVLPIDELIPYKYEYEGFQFTTKLYSIISRYILSLGAYYSSEFETSFKLHQSILVDSLQFKKDEIDFPIFSKIITTTKKLVVDEAARLAQQAYNANNQYEIMLMYIKAIQLFDPNNYSGLLLSAIHTFRTTRNIAQSLEYINKASANKNDYTWAYSKAFLLGYSGELNAAYKIYELAFNHKADPTAHIQTIDFMRSILIEEPAIFQLHYCIGLVLMKKSKLPKQAIESFRFFITLAKENKLFLEHVDFAEMYILKCSE